MGNSSIPFDWDSLTDIDEDGVETNSYIRFDEFDDVVSTLGLLKEAAQLALEQPFYWKWILLACHSALQGTCVCFLTRTDGSGALDEKSE